MNRQTSSKHPVPAVRRNAFMLVELLMIVVIAAALAALLPPALNRAREEAGAAACLNNIKQIAVQFGVYANDFADHLPAMKDQWSYMGFETGKRERWMSIPDIADRPFHRYLNDKTLACPSDLADGSLGITVGKTTWEATGSSYGGNFYLNSPSQAFKMHAVGRVSRIKGPERTIYGGEHTMMVFRSDEKNKLHKESYTWHWRIPGAWRSNVFFVDLHAAPLDIYPGLIGTARPLYKWYGDIN